jgi:thiamine transporter 2/3
MIGNKLAVPVLLLYVFFRDFRPSEPFLTPFLNETKEFTKHEINNMIYPVWSYSQLPIFIVVLIFTDAVRYRPMIWFGAMGYVSTWLLLVFGTTVKQMQLMQVSSIQILWFNLRGLVFYMMINF